MKRNQDGFGVIELLIIIVVLASAGFGAWYVVSTKDSAEPPVTRPSPEQQKEPDTTSNSYTIIGTESYKCTKSIPAQCSGNIKIQDPMGATRVVKIDNTTNFNGTDPLSLYVSDKSPLSAIVKLTGEHVDRIVLQSQKSGLYFREKYPNEADKDKCLAEYYEAYPDSKPGNQRTDVISLAPPCPGVPQ